MASPTNPNDKFAGRLNQFLCPPHKERAVERHISHNDTMLVVLSLSHLCGSGVKIAAGDGEVCGVLL